MFLAYLLNAFLFPFFFCLAELLYFGRVEIIRVILWVHFLNKIKKKMDFIFVEKLSKSSLSLEILWKYTLAYSNLHGFRFIHKPIQ